MVIASLDGGSDERADHQLQDGSLEIRCAGVYKP
jgi:hypothetical protein